jgi:hypothetical protein
MKSPVWEWWIGLDEERYSESFATREDALEAGRDQYDEGFYVMHACQRPIRLAEAFCTDGVDDRLERFDEGMEHLHDPDDWQPIIELTAEQMRSLSQTLEAAADEWQRRNGLTFIPFAFTESKPAEYIPPEPKSRT